MALASISFRNILTRLKTGNFPTEKMIRQPFVDTLLQQFCCHSQNQIRTFHKDWRHLKYTDYCEKQDHILAFCIEKEISPMGQEIRQRQILAPLTLDSTILVPKEWLDLNEGVDPSD